MSNNRRGNTVTLNFKLYILITAFLKTEHRFLERQCCIYLNYHQLRKTEQFLRQDCYQDITKIKHSLQWPITAAVKDVWLSPNTSEECIFQSLDTWFTCSSFQFRAFPAEGLTASEDLHNPPLGIAMLRIQITSLEGDGSGQCNYEAEDSCGGWVNLFFFPSIQRGEKTLLAGKTWLPPN